MSTLLNYLPGCEWLYLKCYGGPQCLEEWLLERIGPKLQQWRDEQVFRLFHFVRFLDPDYHLRIRFLIPGADSMTAIVGDIHQSLRDLVESEQVWRLELDTYQPEIGRYGAERMRLVEELFDLDSQFWLSALRQMGPERAELTWKAAFVSVDRLLSAFGANIRERLDQMEAMRDSFAAEFGLTRSLKMQLDAKYRRDTGLIGPLMAEGFSLVEKALAARDQALAGPVAQLARTFPDKTAFLSGSLPRDLIHLSLNRCFRTRHRFQELVVYDFLARHYQSRLARGTDPGLSLG